MNITVAVLLVARMLQTRPRRTILFLLGYGLGVAVMVALLAVGDALLVQAQDKDVVSGGDVVVLPEGIDPEVLKVGGVTGMFLSIPNARYFVRQVLLGPRYRDAIVGASPELADKPIYVQTAQGTFAALAQADVPSLARQTGSATAITSSAWTDTADDRAWIAPTPQLRLLESDRFHLPVPGSAGTSWAEWWYFNFMGSEGLYGYVTFSVNQRRQAHVTVSVRLPGGRLVRWAEEHLATAVPLDGPAFTAGAQSAVLVDGIYHLQVSAADFQADLRFAPVAGLDFPPIERQAGVFQSGYVVPALRAAVVGQLRVGTRTISLDGIGYHDHNWGLWQDVTWEWGAASNPSYALLTGLIHHPSLAGQEMFVSLYAADPGHPGVLATFRAPPPLLDNWHSVKGAGDVLRVPGRLQYRASNNAGDQLAVVFLVDDVIATPTPGLAFLQLRGRFRLSGSAGGRAIEAEMPGFAETFVAPPRKP